MRRKPAQHVPRQPRTTTDEVYDEGGAAEFLGTVQKDRPGLAVSAV